MNITRLLLYQGCLIASISHAIMTNVYPELAYEQSWDGKNYSIQDSRGLRGTITFENNYCVGAFRNDNTLLDDDINHSEAILSEFPSNIVNIARKETLQYLLVEKAGIIFPSITSIFWADNTTFHYSKNNEHNLQQDLTLIQKIILPEKEAFKAWKNYYDMSDDSIALLKYLLVKKRENFTNNIVLDDDRIKLIPGNQLQIECVESFRELNITIH